MLDRSFGEDGPSELGSSDVGESLLAVADGCELVGLADRLDGGEG
jgi:hypothetical protein